MTEAALNAAMNYISGEPEKNLPKLLGLNASLFGFQEQEKNREKYGCNIP